MQPEGKYSSKGNRGVYFEKKKRAAGLRRVRRPDHLLVLREGLRLAWGFTSFEVDVERGELATVRIAPKTDLNRIVAQVDN